MLICSVEEKMRRGLRILSFSSFENALRRILVAGDARFLVSARPLCTTSSSGNSKSAEVAAREDAYKQLENLDFMTAAKMLFTAPPQKKKFGIDFHLVQLFFACMPSLAVYLVAQYARYEIRRMEAEVELKKKQAEEEEKAKEEDLKLADEEPDLELYKVKVRLDALEETVKEIVDETKKLSTVSISKDHGDSKKEQPAPVDPSPPSKLEGSSSAADGQNIKLKAGKSVPDSSTEKLRCSDAATVGVLPKDQNKQDGKT